MKTASAISIILLVIGLLYAWTWNQGVKQMGELAMAPAGKIQNWNDLRREMPQLCLTFRLLRINPFAESDNGPADAMAMAQRLYSAAGRNALAGVIVASVGVGFFLGFAANQVRRRSYFSRGL